MRVLYVDDDPSMTKTVELMLRTAGHVCDTTYLGERAVQLAQMKEYDAIILDIMLPDIDGYEVIERLRQTQVSTPILIQTGLVDRATTDDAEAFGADDILLKPFDTKELIGHLRRTVPEWNPILRASSAGHSPMLGPRARIMWRRLRQRFEPFCRSVRI